MKIKSINPRTDTVIKEFESTSQKNIVDTVKNAKKAQKDWATLPTRDRVAAIQKIAKIIERDLDEVVDLIYEECGMPKEETEGAIADDILAGVDRFIEDYKSVKTLDYSDEVFESKVEFIPQGVVGHIGIWNYPFWQTMITAIPALLTGNAVVYKPSELASMVGEKAASIIWEAGVPKDVFNLVLGGSEEGRAIVESDVDMIVFTGGIETGNEIIKKAGIKPLLLELSGNDAAIVCEDVNMEQAIKGILWGGLLHGGQVCIRIKRVFVPEKIAEDFVKRYVEGVKKLKLGKEISPLIRDQARDKVDNQVKEAIKSGAKILTGGKKATIDGYYYEPTVLFYKDSDLKMYGEEIFGPVVQIQVVKNEDEAIRLANDSVYGLGATVWSKDTKKAEEIARSLETGTVWINDSNCPIPCAVYCGGEKQSGIASSQNRIMSFLKKKTIINNSKCETREWWYPYE